MKIDRTTKLLLAFIALGLWLNAIAPLWHPAKVAADEAQVEHDIHKIADAMDTISNGLCLNSHICK